MRRILTIAFFAVFMCGCAADESYSEKLHFVGSIIPDQSTRVGIEADESAGVSHLVWHKNDRIGIYADDVYSNVAYAASAADACADFVAETESIDAGERFYAYYPFSVDCNGCAVDRLPCSISSQQTFLDGDNSMKLFMYAVSNGVTDNTVRLEFENVFSVMEFGLKGRDVVLSEMCVESSVPLAAKTSLDLTTGLLGDYSETSQSVALDFGTSGLALSAENIYVPVGVIPFDTDDPVKLTFTDMSGRKFVKEIWTGGMSLPSNTHLRQPLAAFDAADFKDDYIWNDDFSDAVYSGNNTIGVLTSGEYVYSAEGPVERRDAGLRIGKVNYPAYLIVPALLPEGKTADLVIEMSLRSLTSSVDNPVELYVLSGAGTLSVSAVNPASYPDYRTCKVALSGADSSTRLRIGGIGFYIDLLRIYEGDL